MQKSTSAQEKPVEIEFLLFDQFSNHCLANALEPFRAANTLSNRPLYKWRLSTLDGEAVSSSSGLTVVPDAPLSANSTGDFLFVISSYSFRQFGSARIRSALGQASRRFQKVVGLDTGAWLLAEAGALNGHKATIHWDVIDSFAERFLDVDVQRERFVIDGKRITCGGAMTAFDLVLTLISEAHGVGLRLDVAALFMAEGRGSTDTAPRPTELVGLAYTMMQENLEEPLSVAEIARNLDWNGKEMERRFKAEFGAPPARVYRHLRLALARQLAENTSLPVSEIAIRSGYQNASAMTRAYLKEFGMTPSAGRQRG